LFKQCILIYIEQPNFLAFTWCGEFGDRVPQPGYLDSVTVAEKLSLKYIKDAFIYIATENTNQEE
jgi:hypothetical protein